MVLLRKSRTPGQFLGTSLIPYSIFTFIWVPETKGVPIECCEALFSGSMKHRAWTSKKRFPPLGIPPLPDHLVAGQTAYIESHQHGHKNVEDEDRKVEREEIEVV